MLRQKKRKGSSKVRRNDLVRRIAFAKYVEHVLLQMPKVPATTTSRYGLRFLAEVLFDRTYQLSATEPSDQKQEINAKSSVSRDFRNGKKIKTISEFVEVMHLVRQRVGSYVVHTDRGDLTLQHVPPLSDRQVLEAFQVFTRFSNEELKLLGLPENSHHPLLQESFINLSTYRGKHLKKIPDIYREVYQLSLNCERSASVENEFGNLDEVREYVESRFENSYQGAYRLKNEIGNAISHLLVQAGTGQSRFVQLNDQDEYIRNHISARYLNQLVDSIQTNDYLSDRFPLYLKNITLETVEPFSLPTPSDNPNDSFLSKKLLDLQLSRYRNVALIDNHFSQLATYPVMRAIGHFYIRVDSKKLNSGKHYAEKQYKGFSQNAHLKMRRSIGTDVQVHFTVSTTGIGVTNSLLVKVVNQALLSDINGLRETFFPVAHDLFVHQINSNQRVLSPVINHSFVQLCDNETVDRAMQLSCSRDKIYTYEECSAYDTRGVGNYGDLDILLGAANAALTSRLHAISKTDIGPEGYLLGIIERIEQQALLDDAQKLLTGYPFSSIALTNQLNTQLIERAVKQKSSNSFVLFNARLTIVETLLTEGTYRKAYCHIQWVHSLLKQASDESVAWVEKYNSRPHRERIEDKEELESFNLIPSQLLARYEICLAKYLTILEEEEESNYFLGLFQAEKITRKKIVEQAWIHLIRAEMHLTVHLIKHQIIDEISQATFQPYYRLLAQIYYNRAKLFLWYPSILSIDNSDYELPITRENKLYETKGYVNQGRLFLFERARVYAACDGHHELYIISTAYQCRTWLIHAFTMNFHEFQAPGDTVRFNRQDCFAWAKKLRDHAILQYASIGQHCYQAIKENSGFGEGAEDRQYSRLRVQNLPQIRETFGSNGPSYDVVTGVLYLDMDYLAVRRHMVDDDHPESNQAIYLFGPKACHLFLIRGLYYLSNNDLTEFPSQTDSKKADRSMSLKDWGYKLERCYRLFNYAWSIASNGCGLEFSSEPSIEKRITREMGAAEKYGIESGITDNHAISVWNLYPHGTIEISAMGKVFAAACIALLCCITQDEAVMSKHRHEMHKLLDTVPCSDQYQINASLEKEMHGQKRLNGYLIKYLERCAKLIQTVANTTENRDTNTAEFKEIRDKLLTEMFSLTAL